MSIINKYAMTDLAIAQELGKRLRRLRLQNNYTQEDVKRDVVLSLSAVKRAENGDVKLTVLIKLLRHYQALDSLDMFIPDPGLSPLQLAKLKGKPRQRARTERKKRKKSPNNRKSS